MFLHISDIILGCLFVWVVYIADSS